MEEREPYKIDARDAKRRRSYRGPAVCVRCGYAQPAGLTPATVHSHEKHHPYGRNHVPAFTIPLCVRCHREISALIQAAGVTLQPLNTDLDREIEVTRANALHLEQMAEAEQRRLTALERHRERLNRTYPNWREELQDVDAE